MRCWLRLRRRLRRLFGFHFPVQIEFSLLSSSRTHLGHHFKTPKSASFCPHPLSPTLHTFPHFSLSLAHTHTLSRPHTHTLSLSRSRFSHNLSVYLLHQQKFLFIVRAVVSKTLSGKKEPPPSRKKYSNFEWNSNWTFQVLFHFSWHKGRSLNQSNNFSSIVVVWRQSCINLWVLILIIRGPVIHFRWQDIHN